jgi:hypothetical protein
VEKRWFPQEKGSRKIMRGGGLENKECGFSEDQTMVASIFTKPCRLKTAYTATYIDMLIYRINVYIYIYIVFSLSCSCSMHTTIVGGKDILGCLLAIPQSAKLGSRANRV